jgi:lincosamide nucleotidyltransferase A/C/D/E
LSAGGRGLRRIVPATYRVIARTPLAPLLRSGPVQRLKKRLVSMPPERVPDVMDALESRQVRAWVAGGWGVDALVGEQTRAHIDLDVVFESSGDGEQRAFSALADLGFRVMRRERVPGRIWSERIALSDGEAQVVDLHPVRLEGDGVRVVRADGSEVLLRGPDAFSFGTLAGRPVPCLAAVLQAELHRGYTEQGKDRRDMERLQAL